jgi:hypothetical protein
LGGGSGATSTIAAGNDDMEAAPQHGLRDSETDS